MIPIERMLLAQQSSAEAAMFHQEGGMARYTADIIFLVRLRASFPLTCRSRNIYLYILILPSSLPTIQIDFVINKLTLNKSDNDGY